MNAKYRCAICGAALKTQKWVLHGFDILECDSCSHIQVGNIPSEEELARYYTDAFGHSAELSAATVRQVAEGMTGEYPLSVASQELRLPRDAVILDVGCSAGYDLFAFRKHGFKNVAGIEISPEARKLGALLDIPIYKDVKDFRQSGLRPDFVYLKHNLEHQPDPVGLINSLREILNPGGHILIGIPNIHSLNGSLGPYWEWFTPPIHLHYFSKASLRWLCQRVGLEPLHFYSARGHGQPFLRHLLYFSRMTKDVVQKVCGNPYVPEPNNLIRQLTDRISAFPSHLLSPLTKRLDRKLLFGAELWVTSRPTA